MSSSIRDVVMSMSKEGHMTHRQSVNGSTTLIAPIPVPIAVAWPQRAAGSATPGGGISLSGLGDDPSSASTGTDLKVYIKETREKK